MQYVVTFVAGAGVGVASCAVYIKLLRARIDCYEFFIHNRLDRWTKQLLQ